MDAKGFDKQISSEFSVKGVKVVNVDEDVDELVRLIVVLGLLFYRDRTGVSARVYWDDSGRCRGARQGFAFCLADSMLVDASCMFVAS